MASYWKKQGRYQEEYNKLFEEFVPDCGATKTIGGEVLRAASRIYYDAYNNGFYNNTSGALNYLDEWSGLFGIEFEEIYLELKGKVNTGGYSDFESESVQNALDTMVDLVVKWIVDNPVVAMTKSDADLFDYEDPDMENCYY